MEIVRKITTWKMAEKEHHENGRPENTRYCICKKNAHWKMAENSHQDNDKMRNVYH